MGELHQKPSDYRRGDRQISASALNQMLTAIPRVITGDGVEVKRYGDRIVLESDPDFFADLETLRTFVVIAELPDCLVCVQYDYTQLAREYDPNAGQEILDEQLYNIYYVAKPDNLQQTSYEAQTVELNGVPVLITYEGVGCRLVTPSVTGTDVPTPYRCPKTIQLISPSYFPGAIITARFSLTGYSIGTDDENNPVPITWLDTNADGRAWVTESRPQVVTIKSRLPINGYYDAVWKLRDNEAQTWLTQSKIWVKDLAASESLEEGASHTAIFAGYEAGGPYYVSIVDDNIGNELSNTSAWLLTTDDPTAVDAWDADENYSPGDLVTHSSATWICVAATTGEPGVSGDWLEITLVDAGDYDAAEPLTSITDVAGEVTFQQYDNDNFLHNQEPTPYGEGDYVQEVRPLFVVDLFEGTGTVDDPDCLAVLDVCKDVVRYMWFVNGVWTLNDTPCTPCTPIILIDPGIDPVTVLTPCCKDPMPAIVCMNLGDVLIPGSVSFTLSGLKITLTLLPQTNQFVATWVGSLVVTHSDYPPIPNGIALHFDGVMKCDTSGYATAPGLTAGFTWYGQLFSGGPGNTFVTGPDHNTTEICKPFSLSTFVDVYAPLTGLLQSNVAITIKTGTCSPCASYPTVVLNTANITGTAATLSGTGTGLSLVPSENIFTFTLAGGSVTGICTASTATTWTCVLTWVTAVAGALSAKVCVNGCCSAAAVQVATVIAPLSGGIAIYGVGHAAYYPNVSTLLTAPIKAGLVVACVQQFGDGTTPKVTYNGVAMTVASGPEYNAAGVAVTQLYIVVGASSGAKVQATVYSLVPNEVFLEILNITGLANNAPDKSASAQGSGGKKSGNVIFNLGGAPHEITTDAPHGLSTGDTVTIAGCIRDNGTFTITVTATNKFTLDGTAGLGLSYIAETGTWTNGSGSASPDTGQPATNTSVNDEAVIACFGLRCTAQGNWTWGGSFVDGGQQEIISVGAYNYLGMEGRRILSTTLKPDASLTLSASFAGVSWAGVEVTYS